MKARSLNLVLIAFVLLLALPQAGQARAAASPRAVAANPLLPPVEGRQQGNVVPASGYSVFLPFVAKPPFSCATGSTYSSGPAYRTEGSPLLQAVNHPDKNLAVRGYINAGTTTASTLAYSVGPDPRAPQLTGLFSPAQRPSSFYNYKVNDWDWGTMHIKPTPLAAGTMVSLPVSIGTTIYVPPSGYNIGGNPTMEVLVLYADATRITLHYTRNDSAADGYVIHIEGFCVDPNLLSLYQSLDYPTSPRYTAGLGSLFYGLVNLWSGQPIGKANATAIGVAIRDTGTFEDARLRDWWVAFP